MGCAVSRPGVVSSPSYEDDVSSCSYNMSRSASASADLGSASASASAMSIWSRPVRLEAFKDDDEDERRRRRSGREAAVAAAARLGSVRPCVEGEQAAAGWPAWLSAVAAEAVHGWVPLRADGFEKLEKVGQGTYSSVFRARELATGRLVALKKVRFDSVEPESVRFMAREILILRRLQGHPNVVGLEGLVTSRSSPSIYLVFEYLEHDLAGLSSSPDITFTESQVRHVISFSLSASRGQTCQKLRYASVGHPPRSRGPCMLSALDPVTIQSNGDRSIVLSRSTTVA
jgi:hypothetical protein